jgi:hypothetical protein
VIGHDYLIRQAAEALLAVKPTRPAVCLTPYPPVLGVHHLWAKPKKKTTVAMTDVIVSWGNEEAKADADHNFGLVALPSWSMDWGHPRHRIKWSAAFRGSVYHRQTSNRRIKS